MANEFQLSFQGSANLYVILRRPLDAAVWNGSDFVPWDDDAITTFALPLTHRGGDVYQGDFPAGIAAGRYLAIHYLRSGASPDTDDLLLTTRAVNWQSAEPAPQPEPVPVAPDALTSVEAITQYLRLTSPSQDQLDLLASLVNEVSARIERLCGRKFLARQWVDRHARSEHGRLTLRHYPLIAIDRMSAGVQPALHVTCSRADALLATAAMVFDETGLAGELRLKTIDTQGSESITNLSLQTYPTTALLAAAVEDVQGWSASLVRNMPTNLLHAMGALSALRRPAALMYPDQELSAWDIEHDIGCVNLWRPIGRVMVAYRAGYTTIPADLRLVATELVAHAYQQGRQNPAIKSETLGDYSYTLATQAPLCDVHWNRLRPYMEVR